MATHETQQRPGINYNVHACFPQENGQPYVWLSTAGSLQRSGFRENTTDFLTSVVRDSVFQNKQTGEM